MFVSLCSNLLNYILCAFRIRIKLISAFPFSVVVSVLLYECVPFSSAPHSAFCMLQWATFHINLLISNEHLKLTTIYLLFVFFILDFICFQLIRTYMYLYFYFIYSYVKLLVLVFFFSIFYNSIIYSSCIRSKYVWFAYAFHYSTTYRQFPCDFREAKTNSKTKQRNLLNTMISRNERSKLYLMPKLNLFLPIIKIKFITG